MQHPRFDDIMEVISSVTRKNKKIIKKMIHGKYSDSEYVALRYSSLDLAKDIRKNCLAECFTMAAWVMNLALNRINLFDFQRKTRILSHQNSLQIHNKIKEGILSAFDRHIENPETKFKDFIVKVLYKEPFFQIIEDNQIFD